MIFTCEDCGIESEQKKQEMQNKLAFLKRQLAEIMMIILKDGKNHSLIMEKLGDLIFIMVNQFQGFFIENNQFRSNENQISRLDMDRLYRIIKYIYLNYDTKITLEDLANLEHLSSYYISHLIKDNLGLSFQNFLNYVRVEFAERFLAEGKLTLTQISEYCGFSSSAYFNKCFPNLKRLSHRERSLYWSFLYKTLFIFYQKAAALHFSSKAAATLFLLQFLLFPKQPSDEASEAFLLYRYRRILMEGHVHECELAVQGVPFALALAYI